MKKIFYNDDNLKSEDIDETVIRLKALIVNSNNQILLGYSHKTFQFPGGHLEQDETLEDGLLRELREETGMIFNFEEFELFQVIKYYSKNYRNSGKNRENYIYYYLIKTDNPIDLKNTHYDEYELAGNYELIYVNLKDVVGALKESIVDNPINEIIVKEMLTALENSKLIWNPLQKKKKNGIIELQRVAMMA